MKHPFKITLILLGMFFLTQLIGIFVVSKYVPQEISVIDEKGEKINKTIYNLPYGVAPPQTIKEKSTPSLIFSFVVGFIIAVILMFILMKYKTDFLIRIWFFVVIVLALGITINSFLIGLPYSSLIALLIAFPLAFYKVFKKNVIIHNLTELFIYPGIAAIFVSLILAWTNNPIFAITIIFLIISVYDIYAVWHAGFMQKMANYQIKKLKLFTGFFVPHIGKKEKELLLKLKKSKNKSLKSKKIKINVAILGGGDIVFPIIFAGIVFNVLGLVQSLIISASATLSLAFLLYISQKGKFYPAMPFIAIGTFIGLLLSYLISF